MDQDPSNVILVIGIQNPITKVKARGIVNVYNLMGRWEAEIDESQRLMGKLTWHANWKNNKETPDLKVESVVPHSVQSARFHMYARANVHLYSHTYSVSLWDLMKNVSHVERALSLISVEGFSWHLKSSCSFLGPVLETGWPTTLARKQ